MQVIIAPRLAFKRSRREMVHCCILLHFATSGSDPERSGPVGPKPAILLYRTSYELSTGGDEFSAPDRNGDTQLPNVRPAVDC
jgi:hypothetical protein